MELLTPFEPNWVSPTFDTITDILVEKNISLNEFYFKTNFNHTSPIDLHMANKLADLLGSTPKFWIKRDEQYRSDCIRLKINILDNQPVIK